jgi:tetratricopeptide (TPR) repeat protein
VKQAEPTPAVSAAEPLSLAEQLQEEFEAEPTSAAAALRWARLLSGEQRYQEAEQVLNRSLAAGGSNLQVLEELEETRLAAARARLEIAQQRAAAQRSAEAVALVADLTAEFNRLEIDLYYERCERYPQEPRWQLLLGRALERAGNFAQAIRCFRQAAEHRELAVEAQLGIGQCWQYLKQFPQALASYQTAIAADASSRSAAEAQKMAYWRAAVLAEGLQDVELAARFWTSLVAIDPQFRDAQAQLARLSGSTAESDSAVTDPS